MSSSTTVLAAVTLFCLATTFGSRSVGDRSDGPVSSNDLSHFLEDEATEERPLADRSVIGVPRRPSVSPKLHQSWKRLSNYDGRMSSLLWQPTALVRYQRRNGKPSLSLQKKLKSDVFYAARGRRGGDSSDDDLDRRVATMIGSRWWPRQQQSGTADNSWTSTLISPEAQEDGLAKRLVAGGRQGAIDEFAFNRAVQMLNGQQDEEGEENVEREPPTEDWRLIMPKREPPTGFHAIRGKRHVTKGTKK